jgi:hypothetical protein
MAKAMAKIENSIVVNVEWCSERTSETDTMKDIDDRNIEIGDTYAEGHFYRDGNMIMSIAEKLADAERALAIMLGGDV